MSRVEDKTANPLVTSTPRPLTCNGVTPSKRAISQCDESVINGNTNGNLVAESTISIDVLSVADSDAGGTLRSRKMNTSISSELACTGREHRPRLSSDILYSIAKEMLMTERTYKRDLELLTVSWSLRVSALASCGSDLVEALGRPCLALEPMALAQGAFLAKLDKCLVAASPNRFDDIENAEYKKISELLYDYLSSTYEAYSRYISRVGALLGRLEWFRREDSLVASLSCSSFESETPLPIATLILRPLHRLLFYRTLNTELSQVVDNNDVRQLEQMLANLCDNAREQLRHAENHAALCQLQRDIVGYDKLLVADREFVRLGCVYKHSDKGLQQRMLFLFSDILLIASKSSDGSTKFKSHLVLPIQGMEIQDCGMPNSFTLTCGESTSTFSASNEAEFLGWSEAIRHTIQSLSDNPADVDTALTAYEQDKLIATSVQALSSDCSVGLTHVCWHRVTSLSREHLHWADATHLSGYLLRKFKKTHGWQKLWVVFASFALFFYKSWQDEAPLVSLPLLGYSVGPPNENDGINKDFVFKLQFKNHVYFFRADSQYTYNRWTQTLRGAMAISNKQQNRHSEVN